MQLRISVFWDVTHSPPLGESQVSTQSTDFEGTRIVRNVWTTHPKAQCNISQHVNPQPHRSENLGYRKRSLSTNIPVNIRILHTYIHTAIRQETGEWTPNKRRNNHCKYQLYIACSITNQKCNGACQYKKKHTYIHTHTHTYIHTFIHLFIHSVYKLYSVLGTATVNCHVLNNYTVTLEVQKFTI